MDWHPSSRKLYRSLLYLYPAEFREEYGAQMDFAAAESAETDPHACLWPMLVGDVVRNAPREHLHILQRDLRNCVRLFARSPGWTATSLCALALGIGAAVTIFSLIDAVLLRSLPFGDAERLTYLWTPLPRYKTLPHEMAPSYADVLAYRQQSRSFSGITAFRLRTMTLNAQGGASRVAVAVVLGNFFETLQATPIVGRVIDTADESSGDTHVAVISDALWTSQFHRGLSALGQTIRLNGAAFRILGVMPPGFVFPHQNDYRLAPADLKRTDVWVPAELTPRQRTDRMVACDAAVGRLRPGVTLERAQAEMSVIQRGLDRLNLREMQGSQSLLVSLRESAVGPVRPLMWLLAGAVFLVLLIACDNVANLLMARSAARGHEMGVRTALGAPRSRLLRQMLTESIVLSITGGAIGVLLCTLAVRLLAVINPGDVARLDELSVDWRVLAFSLAISIATGLSFSAFPALAASRANLVDLLRESGGRGITGSGTRVRRALVAANVALSVVLLGGAGLLIRSYLAVQGTDKGFDESTLTMDLASDGTNVPLPQMSALRRAVLERVTTAPGVIAAGSSNTLPLSHSESSTTFEVEGYPNQRNQSVAWRRIAGDYFAAMTIPLVAGRYVTTHDIPESGWPTKVVVSQSFAEAYFPGEDALGGHFRHSGATEWSAIVGIVADVRHFDLESPPTPTVYEPSWDVSDLAIHTPLAPAAILPAVRSAIREAGAPFVVGNVKTMKERTGEAAARRRFQTVLLAAFAAIAVFLALVGLYGLLSYMVRERLGEIGVRIALGADRQRIIRMVLRDGLTIACAGLAIGLGTTAAVARLGASMLYGVRPLDPVTFGLLPLLIVMVTMSACVLPAWRASRVDPVRALRN
jgi:putative ABC transport system permease protein